MNSQIKCICDKTILRERLLGHCQPTLSINFKATELINLFYPIPQEDYIHSHDFSCHLVMGYVPPEFILKPEPPIPQSVTAFGDRAFKEVAKLK